MSNSRTRLSTIHRWSVTGARLALLAWLAPGQLVYADPQQEMLFFGSVEGSDTFSASDPALEDFDSLAKVDVLYTVNSDRFRFLAEYTLSNEESELERLQAAWQIDDRTRLWLGRFHAISQYWTSEFHHGQYMQTSISRPGLEEWEDESGPMASHITGMWLEHEYAVNDQSAINLGLAAGLAPKFAGQELRPFDFLDIDSGRDLAISGRVVYRPDILSANQVGLAFADNDISVVAGSTPNRVDLNAIHQRTIGVFANWSWSEWRVSTHWVYFDMDLRLNGGETGDHFVLGYLQGEYAATENWTVFGRTEQGHNEDDSQYLELLPAVVSHRNMLGLRWDFADSHALTLEVADTRTQGRNFEHDDFKELRLQWSAVFP